MADQDLAVRIVPYDSRAPEIFEEIKQFICNTIPYEIEVEHIGSTAVVGLGGKGVIDILIITKQEYMRKIVEVLESNGYKSGTIPERLFASGPYRYNEKELHIHIHITFFGSKEHKDKLLFRGYLRQYPDEAKTYYELKKQWSIEAGSDKAKFSELKTPYVNEVLEKARKELKMSKEGFKELVSLSEAMEIIDKIVKPIEDEKVKLEDALGRILATDVVSPIDVPHFRKAAMDGFAVIASDTFGTSDTNPKKLRIIDSISAGMVLYQKKVQSGECVEITTGAPMPDGADAVMMVEYTEKKDEEIILYKSIAPGENIVEIGSDIKKGTKVFNKGTYLNSRYTGVLSALGISTVLVKRKPIIGVLSTGNEIINPDETLEEARLVVGKIYDINSRTIVDALREQNCEIVDMGIVRDDKKELKAKISEGIKKSDFLLVSGGSSLGKEDLMKEVVSELGELLVHGIAIKPGKPTVIGKIEGRLIIGLPGYPTSALSNFYILVIPILEKMLGVGRGTIYCAPIIEAELARKVVSTIGRYQFLPVKVDIEGEKKYATPVLKGSSAITTLANAQGFVEISENTEVIAKGELVKVRLF